MQAAAGTGAQVAGKCVRLVLLPLGPDAPVDAAERERKYAGEEHPDGVVLGHAPVLPGIALQEQAELRHTAAAVLGVEAHGLASFWRVLAGVYQLPVPPVLAGRQIPPV